MTITLNGKSIEVMAEQDENLYELLTRLGYRLNAPCGGGGRCGKCRVTIDNAHSPTDGDRKLIGVDDLFAGVRLACCTEPFEGMAVRFEQANERLAHIATEGKSVKYDFMPQVKVKNVVLAAPELSDQTADLERLSAALGLERLEMPRELLNTLPALLRQGNWKITVVVKGSQLLDVNPAAVYGVAVDIGTTTLACYLINLITGEEAAVASALNPQKAWGDDVITRADYASSGGLDELQASVSREIDSLIDRMCKQAQVDKKNIYQVVLAGNTVMMHLFAGVTPQHIAQSPFVPAFTSALSFPASLLGLSLHPAAMATLLPCVAGYVGADTVAGMLAVGMREDSETMLLIDIGTNGEIALSANGRLYACSTAAGPAFEGAHISSGMGGVAGAINKASIGENGIRFSTIGNAPVRGVCGSGLLDLIAGLLDAGVIEDTGRIDADSAPSWLTISEGRIAVNSDNGIYLTGRDIREVQLAKGAIAAGVDVLAAAAGIAIADISHVYLAGGFGSYMDKRSAGRIGLIPQELVGRTVAIGNSSGAGAKAALLSTAAMAEAERLAGAVKYIELSARKDFQDAFMDKMFF